jgi:hypothetical protein
MQNYIKIKQILKSNKSFDEFAIRLDPHLDSNYISLLLAYVIELKK